MATPAHTLAKASNAPSSATAFVRPGEQAEFEDFTAGHLAELQPQTLLEDALAQEVVHAVWRLRRCASLESNPPLDATPDELDRLQTSIDRARASARTSLHRSLAELRRLQSERVYRDMALSETFTPDNPGQADLRRLDPPARFIKNVEAADAQLRKDVIEKYRRASGAAETDSAKQTQSGPPAPLNIARNAPCPCGSGEKYKRCCGKSAPPLLITRAA